MATESIKKRTARLEVLDSIALQKLLEEARADIALLRADNATLAAALDTLATKLNADAGVTDVNYATGNAAAVTSGTPTFIA